VSGHNAQQPAVNATPVESGKRRAQQLDLCSILEVLPGYPPKHPDDLIGATHLLFPRFVSAIARVQTSEEWDFVCKIRNLLDWRCDEVEICLNDAVRLQRLAQRRLPHYLYKDVMALSLLRQLAVEIFVQRYPGMYFEPGPDPRFGFWFERWYDEELDEMDEMNCGDLVWQRARAVCAELADLKPRGGVEFEQVLQRAARIRRSDCDAAALVNGMGKAEFAAVLAYVEQIIPDVRAKIRGGDTTVDFPLIIVDSCAEHHLVCRMDWDGFPPDMTRSGWHRLRNCEGEFLLAKWEADTNWHIFDVANECICAAVSPDDITSILGLQYVGPSTAPIVSGMGAANGSALQC
jgi:hypothetical protein